MHRLIIGALVVAILAGCASTPTQDAAPVEDRAATAGAPPGTPGATTSGAPPSGVTGTPGGPSGAAASVLRDPNNILTAEITGWRVQKIGLKGQAAAPSAKK